MGLGTASLAVSLIAFVRNSWHVWSASIAKRSLGSHAKSPACSGGTGKHGQKKLFMQNQILMIGL